MDWSFPLYAQHTDLLHRLNRTQHRSAQLEEAIGHAALSITRSIASMIPEVDDALVLSVETEDEELRALLIRVRTTLRHADQLLADFVPEDDC